MKIPHIHAEEIKAWADGAEIQLQMTDGSWVDEPAPTWWRGCFYRIKPEPKPDVIVFPHRVTTNSDDYPFLKEYYTKQQLKLTFDGETGKLKSAEVL